jgi:hypothetical protein
MSCQRRAASCQWRAASHGLPAMGYQPVPPTCLGDVEEPSDDEAGQP